MEKGKRGEGEEGGERMKEEGQAPPQYFA